MEAVGEPVGLLKRTSIPMSTGSDAVRPNMTTPIPDMPEESRSPRKKRGVPEGLWLRCEACNATIFRKHLEKNYRMCPDCGFHFYVSAGVRIKQLLDEESFEEWFGDLNSVDPL